MLRQIAMAGWGVILSEALRSFTARGASKDLRFYPQSRYCRRHNHHRHNSKRHVISTEAADSHIVRWEVERPLYLARMRKYLMTHH
jgi:hypothetical protein